MGKAKTQSKPITEVVVKYDLFDLPTAQHKAGLAGILLAIQSMDQRKAPRESIPEVVEQTQATATIRFTETSVRGLFDDLYAARIAEIESKSKWAGTEPKEVREVEETDPETKKPKKVKRFV